MHSRIIFLQPEGEFALEAVAAEVEHKAVDPDGEERGKGYPEFGEAQGVEQGKDGKDEQCRQHVGDEHGKEPVAGVDDDSDLVAG